MKSTRAHEIIHSVRSDGDDVIMSEKKRPTLEDFHLALEKCGCLDKLKKSSADGASEMQEFFDAVEWAVQWRRTMTELSTSGRSQEMRDWLNQVKRQSKALARLLANPSDRGMIHINRNLSSKDLENHGIWTVSDLQPILIHLSEAATKSIDYLKDQGLYYQPLAKTKGFSSADLYILNLATAYERWIGVRAYVGRASKEGNKGGAFMHFVHEISSLFGAPKPSIEAIAAALRKEIPSVLFSDPEK